VALCDLDFFKRVTDRLGHAVGDTVLKRVAGLLRDRCRGTDLVARYGGEEFCIVFADTDAAAAQRICETLREAVAAHAWHEVHAELAVTLSIGISDDPTLATHEQVLAAADRQLYRAKHEGKNRVCWRGNE
jgi:diguanylate cyclase (GGDEF)-like protein